MLNVVTGPILGAKKIRNDGFGNRCIIDGSYFDEGGICSRGHEQGKIYYYLPEDNGKPKKEGEVWPTKVICQAVHGIYCNICPGVFLDGDNVCAGGHQIGKEYRI